MELTDTFEAVRPSIVAFASRLQSTPPGIKPIFPLIIGTGFVVDSRGWVATNRHVTDVLGSLPPNPKTGAHSAVAVVWAWAKASPPGMSGLGIFFVDIDAAYPLTTFSSAGPFYGDDLPDLAFVQLKVRGLPPLKLDEEEQTIRIGRKVATAGFPMGTGPLVAKGKVTQLTPTLRHGIVSGVYPFPCPLPHGFTIDVLTQGGASGSPVFLQDAPLAVGMIESVIVGAENITLAVPSRLIAWGLSSCLESISPSTKDAPTLDELIDKSQPGDQLDWESYLVKKP